MDVCINRRMRRDYTGEYLPQNKSTLIFVMQAKPFRIAADTVSNL